MTEISIFNQFKNDNKPIFYHFLDNFIDDRNGYTSFQCNNFISNNILNKFKKLSKIVLCYSEIDINHTTDEYEVLIYVHANKGDADVDAIPIFNGTEILNQEIFKEFISDNFLIFDLVFDNHNTSLIIFYDDAYYNIFLINSGLGISTNHIKHKIKDMYKPYVNLRIKDVNLVINILVFINFYNHLCVYVYSTKFNKKLYYTYLKKQFEKFEFDINFLDKITFNKKIYSILYNFFSFILLEIEDTSDVINNIIINNLSKIYNDYKYIDNKLIFDRLQFHLDDNNIFIYQQQSGSCTWFCKYWAISIFLIIYKSENYFNIIQQIYSNFLDSLNTIFTKENFKLELQHEDSCIVTMNNIYLKLVNLNLINEPLKNSFTNVINIHGMQINYSLRRNITNNYSNYYNHSLELNTLKDILSYCNVNDNIQTNYNILFYYLIELIHNNYDELHKNINNKKDFDLIENINSNFINSITNDPRNIERFDKIIKIIKEKIQFLKTNKDEIIKELDSELYTIYIATLERINTCNKSNNYEFKMLLNKNEDFFRIPFNAILGDIHNLFLLYNKIDSLKEKHIYYDYYYIYYIINYYLKNKISKDKILDYCKILLKFIIIIKILVIYFDEKNKFNNIFIIESPIIDSIDILKYISRQVHSFPELTLSYDITDYLKFYNNIINKQKEIFKHNILNLFIDPTNTILKNLNLVNITNIADLLEKHILYNNLIISDKLTSLLNKHSEETISLNNIQNETDLLLKNPSYIFNNYLSKSNFKHLLLFIKLNIYVINDNLELKLNLLEFFLNRYIENKLVNNIENIILSLIHIQLLLFNCHSDISKKESYYNELKNYNYYQTTVPDIDLKMLDIILFNIYNDTNKIDEFIKTILNIHTKIKNLSTFINFLLEKHNIVLDKQLPMYNIVIDNSYINKLLNITSSNIILIHDINIYILNFNYYITLELDTDKFPDFYIKNIFYNNNKVILYDEINKPFKKLIPLNCFHMIYEKDNQYNVSYFINNNLQIKHIDNILNNIEFNNVIETIRFSKQNHFLPISQDIIKFQMLIKNFGYNIINFIYVNGPSTQGYIISEAEYEYMTRKFNINFLKKNNNIDNNYLGLIKEKILTSISEKTIKPFDNIISNLEGLKINKEQYSKSLLKLRKKIFKINKYPEKDIILYNLKKNLSQIETKYNESCKNILDISNIHINFFQDNINELINYTIYSNFYNLLQELLITDYKSNTLKIYFELYNNRKYKFEYFFEYIFEFIYGFEILDEQFQKYREIISSFENLSDSDYNHLRKNKNKFLLKIKYPFGPYQLGGEPNKPIRIDKFMMGKGKSAVITPLLALYFSLIQNKIVYIIVPPHLKNQAILTMNQYIYFFKLSSKIIIMSDTEIKHLYLYQKIDNISDCEKKEHLKKLLYKKEICDYEDIKTNSVMLIDEFDTILEPTTSTYNFKFELGNDIDEKIIDSILNQLLIKQSLITKEKDDFNVDDEQLSVEIMTKINDEILHINNLLDTDILKYNINWGIHPTNGYSIPYFNKNKPDINSTFSSIIMTIYLTLYYYIHIEKFNINDNIKNYIIHNNIFSLLFNKDIQLVKDSHIEEIYNLQNDKIKIIKNIITSIKLTSLQLNISFVDILAIENIYKIGYSGTLNINLPQIKNNTYITNDDYDEIINIEYAIKNKSSLIFFKKKELELECKDVGNRLGSDADNKLLIFNSKYDAYIDVCGYFRDYINEMIAKILNIKFNRPVIYITELDIIMVILTESENPKIFNNEKLHKPIFYYDQAHIIGIDIKQENYPILLGLCIIDNNTKYTEIAQGIFRLRKINFGHSIDIFVNDDNVLTKDELFNRLILNNNKSKINSLDLLNFQTYKSEVRKNSTMSLSNHSNEEIVKYYFNQPLDKTKNISKLFDKIIYLDMQLLTDLNLNDYDKLYNLIFNLNYKSISSEKQEEKQTEQQKKKEFPVDILKIIEKNIIYPKLLIKILPLEDYISSLILIECYSEIYCFPNIFTLHLTGLAFILKENKLYLIPGYMIKFYLEYPIFNIYLKQINNIFYDEDIFMTFKNNKLFKIIIKYDEAALKELDYNECYILLIILINEGLSSIYLSIIKYLLSKLETDKYKYPTEFIKELNNTQLKKYICDISSITYNTIENYELTFNPENYDLTVKPENIHNYHKKLFDCLKSENIIFNKYLKYKQKYLKLKTIIYKLY